MAIRPDDPILRDEARLLAEAQTMPQAKFDSILGHLDDAYHNEAELISDTTYDRLIETYEKRFGPRKVIGAAPQGEATELPYFLSSLDKLKTEIELRKWGAKNPGPYVVMDKVDGLSILYLNIVDAKGRTEMMFTRGDGATGKNTSHIIPALNLPKLDYSVAIRGEIVIYKKDWEQYGSGANPRAYILGLIKRKTTYDAKAMARCHFLAFRVMNMDIPPSEQLGYLQEWGFETPYAAGVPTLDFEQLSGHLLGRKDEAPYDMDGLVIYQDTIIDYPEGDNPTQAIAFKLPSEGSETVVTEVVWHPSKHRLLKPVIHFKPIFEGGATLQKTNGDNARYILNNGIGPGAIIKVQRSGDVIPRITEVLQPVEPSFPDPNVIGKWDWNKNGVEIVLQVANQDVIAARIDAFFTKMDIKRIGKGRIKNMINGGMTTLLDILEATPEDFEEIDRVGPDLAASLHAEIHSHLSNQRLSTVMAASGLFPGFGETKIKDIIRAYPQILTMPDSPEELAQKLKGLHGFGETTINFTNKLPEFKQWLLDHPMIHPVMPTHAGRDDTPTGTPVRIAGTPTGTPVRVAPKTPPTVATPKTPTMAADGPDVRLMGRTIVFSGFTDAVLKQHIENQGGKVTSAVSGKTNLLVVKDLTTGQAKIKDAQARGLPIMEIGSFRAWINNLAEPFPGGGATGAVTPTIPARAAAGAAAIARQTGVPVHIPTVAITPPAARVAPKTPTRQPAAVPLLTQPARPTPVLVAPTGNTVNGLNIVFSGFRDKTLANRIEDDGGKVTTAISGRTNILVIKDPAAGRGKMEEAQARGITVLSLADFKQRYGY